MKILPYYEHDFLTHLSPLQIHHKMATILRPPQNFSFNRPSSLSSQKLFEGHLKNKSFFLNRIIYQKNECLPYVIGKVEEVTTGGSKVQMSMRMSAYNALILFFWLSFITFLNVVLLTSFITSNYFSFLALVPITILLFTCRLILLNFFKEVKLTKQILKKHLKEGAERKL